MNKLTETLLALLFPPKCIFCGEILTNYRKENDSLRVCRMCASLMHQSGDSTFLASGSLIDYVVAPLSYGEGGFRKQGTL